MAGPHHILSSVIGGDRELLYWAWHQGRKGIDLDSKESNTARDRGSRVHAVLEDLRRGLRTPVQGMEVTDRNHAEALYAWYDETEPELMFTELSVRSNRLGVRGYIDYVRRCRAEDEPPALRVPCGCGGEGVRIGDQKHGGVTSPHGHVQVGGAYPLMWSEDETHPEPVCGSELLGILIKGMPQPYVVVPAVGTPAMFERALAWYQDLLEMNGKLRPEEVIGHREVATEELA